jgi:membrane protease YdiL (CAAX protease family)
MAQASGPSTIIESNEDIGVRSVPGGWRESLLVLAMVLAPVGLAVILLAAGVSALAGWQIVRGAPVEIPTTANLRQYGLLAYVVASWVDVAAVWLWASRRGLRRDVFMFRRLTWSALTVSIAGFVIAMYGAPVMTHWLSHATGGRGLEVRIDFQDAQSVAIFALLFVITAPVCEEILYRGLLVAWLRRAGWSDAAIWLAGSLLFGANHAIPLGLVWSAVMVGLGGILFALRLRYNSLTPGWIAHFLFNAQPILIHPLIAWLPPGVLPVGS